jgi:DNA invertase Pin-like site-specific DNA recombinase
MNVIYLRVSTEQQADSGLGMEAQLDACQGWAARHGIVAEAYQDAGVSGASALDKRPGLLAAVAALGKGDVLLVAKRDRLGRCPILCAMVEQLVTRKGARIVSAAGEGTDGDGPGDVLMRRMVDAFAEYERLLIAARTKAALQAKRDRGEKTGGDVPIGHTVDDDGQLQADGEEGEAVARILTLRRQGLGYRAVASAMNAEGWEARGKCWHPTTVSRIIAREAA